MKATGTGHACCHHGEVVQGVFLDAHERPQHALVTLPMTEPGTRAEFVRLPGTSHENITVVPDDRPKARRAARIATEVCATITAQRPCGGRLSLHGRVPVGLGMGSSTSDVIATVRAVADGFGVVLEPSVVAGVAVRVEQACDPLMLDDRPMLFAQRQGRVLEVLGTALPPTVVLGCLTGQGRPVDTLAVPTRYGDEDIRAFERLRTMLRKAIARADVELLGRVSTTSARRHQRTLLTPELDTLIGIAEGVGAAGVQVAHSGNVAGLLFDSRDPALEHRLRRGARTLELHGLPTTEPFSTHPDRRGNQHGRAHQRGRRTSGSGAGRRRTGLPAL